MQNRAEAHALSTQDDPLAFVAILQSLSRSCRQMMQIKLAAINVVVGQDQFLDALTVKASITVSDLASKLNVRASTASKMADKLMEHGWIVREVDSEDGRRTRVRLTPAGLEAQATVREVWLRLEDDLTKALEDKNQKEEALGALERVAAVLGTQLSRLR